MAARPRTARRRRRHIRRLSIPGPGTGTAHVPRQDGASSPLRPEHSSANRWRAVAAVPFVVGQPSTGSCALRPAVKSGAPWRIQEILHPVPQGCRAVSQECALRRIRGQQVQRDGPETRGVVAASVHRRAGARALGPHPRQSDGGASAPLRETDRQGLEHYRAHCKPAGLVRDCHRPESWPSIGCAHASGTGSRAALKRAKTGGIRSWQETEHTAAGRAASSKPIPLVEQAPGSCREQVAVAVDGVGVVAIIGVASGVAARARDVRRCP